jgi:acylphosphatase
LRQNALQRLIVYVSAPNLTANTLSYRAQTLGLSGWVKPFSDERLHFVAEGTQGKLRELLEWLQTGANAVQGYCTEWSAHTGDFGDNSKFELKRKDDEAFEQPWEWMSMCAVCMTECPMADMTQRVIHICGHNICSKCFTGMLAASSAQELRCPLCRGSIPREEGDPQRGKEEQEVLNLEEEYQLGADYYGEAHDGGGQYAEAVEAAQGEWAEGEEEASQHTDAQWYAANGEGGEWNGVEGAAGGMEEAPEASSSWHANLREQQRSKRGGGGAKQEARAAKAPISLAPKAANGI